jgi:hypothetical protein
MPYFVDTNLCSKVLKDPSLQKQWGNAKRQFARDGHQYVICPLVLLELLKGLAKPEPEFFNSDLQRLSFLAGSGPRQFLELPGAFVLKTVLGSPSPVARFSSADFDQWLKVTLNADTRDALVQGRVALYQSRFMSFGLDLNSIKRMDDKGLQFHIDNWETRRANKTPPPTRNQWAAVLLYSQGIIFQPADLPKLATALDAAYQYDLAIYKVMPRYNFRSDRNAGDRTDSELLFYLSDADMHIVTGDARFKNRVASSSQVSRIHLLSEF